MASPLSDSLAAQAARARAHAAARLIAAEGPAAFARLDSPPHRSGDDYVFVFDLHGTLVVHPTPDYRGIDLRTLRDVNGQAFGEEFLAVAEGTAGEGWVEYWWPRPGGGEPQRKLSCIVRVRGREFGVGAGIY